MNEKVAAVVMGYIGITRSAQKARCECCATYHIISCRCEGILRYYDDGVKPEDSQDVSLEAAII